MHIEDLKEFIKKEEANKNMGLKEGLEKLFAYNQNNEEITNIPTSNLLVSTCQYLINNGLSPEIVLNNALGLNPDFSDLLLKQEQLVDLALSHKADPNSISYFSYLPSTDLLTLLIKHGLDLDKAFSKIINVYTDRHDFKLGRDVVNDELVAMKEKLLDMLIAQGADVNFIHYLPDHLSYKTYEYLLQKGLAPDVALKTALAIPKTHYLATSDDEIILAEKKEGLLDLALSYKPNFDYITGLVFLPSISLMQKLIDHGLSLDSALKMVLNDFFEQDRKNLKADLVGLLLEKGANANNIIKKIKSFDDMLEILSSNIENFLMNSLHPLTPDNFLKIVLNSKVGDYEYSNGNRYTPDPKKLELQTKLIQEAYSRGADINMIVQDISYEMKAGLIYNHHELLVNYLNPDHLLSWAFSTLSMFYCPANKTLNEWQSQSLKLTEKLVRFAIDNGADVNTNVNGEILDIIKDPDTVELIKSRDNKCIEFNIDIEEMFEGGFGQAIFNPSMIIEHKYNNLNVISSQEAKIPYILHHIWLVSQNHLIGDREQNLKIIFANNDIFAKAPVTWEHIIWTNNKKFIPKSLKSLEKHGIKVKSIYEYKNDLSLFNLIDKLVFDDKSGAASEILKYSLIEHFGGVYTDIDFVFNRDTTDEAHKYNFFTKTPEIYNTNNFLFGASSHHPIVTKMLSLVSRDEDDSPECLPLITHLEATTLTHIVYYNEIFHAYYEKSNKHGNIDVIYPVTKLYDYSDSYGQEDGPVAPFKPEFFENKCPEQKIYYDFINYIDDHEICGAEIFDIGHYSSYGDIWLT